MKNRLYLGNLPPSATEADLRQKFGRFGTVLSAIIEIDAKTGRSKRFAHIEMATPAEAQAAINQLNMTQYDEVVMSVSKVRA
jgi:RNA recognition motif-containing protein